MPVKESSATALVRFTGLGIVCFNRERGRGEIAAIRDGKHKLGVKIRRPVFQDGGKDVITYEDLAAYENLPAEGVRIEIKAQGRPAVEGFEIYEGPEFDRLGNADANDFRWLVNMNALHGGGAVRPTGERRHPLTKIYIGNGLFYTHSLDTKLFFEKVERDAAGAETRREVFGNVGETVGAKIEADEVSFRMSVGGGGGEESHTLKRVEGLPFIIEIKNMDYNAGAVYSDMADYYGYLASPTGDQFELAPVVEDEEADGGAVNQEEFCHPLVADLPSIDEL